jgi:hypothetical protein
MHGATLDGPVLELSIAPPPHIDGTNRSEPLSATAGKSAIRSQSQGGIAAR